ncbi:hypothetical protein ACFSC6_20605 [Rufibacter sediminis]|uniref:Uncharacterized protein n=1 Tax=Rufibacter sediminis TaxID=2762756 RepID=A0ABR6VQB0_9BACT|nr:hypothetical protein [Rufibacter sediminis]MBC3539107.1 hypothetical protein [Rufibacter sediminis]
MLEHSLFRKLPPWVQAELLAQKGEALALRHFKGWSITLHPFENTFLEVWTKQGVEVVGTFHKAVSYMDVIEPYLSVMPLPDGA